MSVNIIPEHDPRGRGAVSRMLIRRAVDEDTPTADRRRAISALPFVAAPATALRTLSVVVQDKDLDTALRRLATDALARVDSTDTAKPLAELVRDDVPAVAAAAATALGRGPGGPAELDLLAGVAKGRRGRVADRARFAAAIIAHRADVAGYDPRRPAGLADLPSSGRAIRAKVNRARAAEARVAAADVAEAMPLIDLGGPAHTIQCAGRRHMLLVAEETAWVLDEPARFAERRWYIGQLAFRNPTNGRYSPGLTILTRPGRGHVKVGLHRSDGTFVYAGTGTVEDDVFFASLNATARPGAIPVSVEARVTRSAASFEIRADLHRGVESRRPKPAG